MSNCPRFQPRAVMLQALMLLGDIYDGQDLSPLDLLILAQML